MMFGYLGVPAKDLKNLIALEMLSIILGEGTSSRLYINLVENIDSLEIELENITFARKFSKLVTNSPVLGKVSNQAIIDFTNAHPALRSKFRYSANGSKLQLVTKLSKKLFIKLLNDNGMLKKIYTQNETIE